MSAKASILADLGERGIYDTVLLPAYRDVPAFGDDCAVVGDGVVVTTDSCPTPLIDQLLDKPDPFAAGWLLATINLSDLAAAGARPAGLVVNYTLPPDTPVTDLKEIIRGVDECARMHGTTVVGGDIRDGRERHLSATAIGHRPRHRNRYGLLVGDRLSRRGATAGDELLLVGRPGNLWGAALIRSGRAVIDEEVEAEVFRLARQPEAQPAAGRLLASRRLATAAIDVSDGLYAAVRVLAGANGTGATMTTDIRLSAELMQVCAASGVTPFRLAENWGDWCLLVAVKPKNVAPVVSTLGDDLVTRVGRLTHDVGALLLEHADGSRTEWEGVDQQRFTSTSWQGDGIDTHLHWMLEQSKHQPT